MTIDQHIASDPELSVWAAANAGTGKTKVLTDRVLRLLLAGSRPDTILCITYTRAASAEMEQRIETQLGEWAIAPEETLCQTLANLTGKAPDAKAMKKARQLFAQVIDAPERIRIQTIHGFCQSVLRRFPLEAGVMPHFSVIDERTSNELLLESQRRLFGESGGSSCASNIETLAGMISEPAFNDLISCIIKDRNRFSVWLERPEGATELKKKIYQNSGVAEDVTQEHIFKDHFNYSDAEMKTLAHACASVFISASL